MEAYYCLHFVFYIDNVCLPCGLYYFSGYHSDKITEYSYCCCYLYLQATWLPGMDHAGIATQSVVERELWRREKKTRREMGRDEFVRRCEEFAGRSVDIFLQVPLLRIAELVWSIFYVV